MKVVFYIADFSGGGAERVSVNLLNYLSNKDISLELVVNKLEGPYVTLLDDSIKVHKLNADIPRSSVWELSKYLDHSKPDIAFSTIFSSNYALILAGKLSNANPKVLVREANSFLTKRQNLSKGRLLYEKLKAWLCYPLADEIFVNSEGSRTELAQVTGLAEKDINILPNPINLEYIRRQASDKLPSKVIDFLNDNPYILAVGRLVRGKGYDVLLNAFHRLSNNECKLIILGEGSLRSELQELIEKFDLGNKVLMPGYADNPYSFMANATLFVLSSRYEGMPNVLLEAMSFELPLVATDCPSGPRELLKDGKYGRLVPVEDSESLSEAIDGQIGVEISNKKEREKYIQQFSIENVGSYFYSFLKEMIA